MVNQAALFNPGNRQDWRRFLTNFSSEELFGIFLIIGEMTPFYFDDVRPLFREMGVPVFGGIFPGIIFGNSWYREGILGCGIKYPVSVSKAPSAWE